MEQRAPVDLVELTSLQASYQQLRGQLKAARDDAAQQATLAEAARADAAAARSELSLLRCSSGSTGSLSSAEEQQLLSHVRRRDEEAKAFREELRQLQSDLSDAVHELQSANRREKDAEAALHLLKSSHESEIEGLRAALSERDAILDAARRSIEARQRDSERQFRDFARSQRELTARVLRAEGDAKTQAERASREKSRAEGAMKRIADLGLELADAKGGDVLLKRLEGEVDVLHRENRALQGLAAAQRRISERAAKAEGDAKRAEERCEALLRTVDEKSAVVRSKDERLLAFEATVKDLRERLREQKAGLDANASISAGGGDWEGKARQFLDEKEEMRRSVEEVSKENASLRASLRSAEERCLSAVRELSDERSANLEECKRSLMDFGLEGDAAGAKKGSKSPRNELESRFAIADEARALAEEQLSQALDENRALRQRLDAQELAMESASQELLSTQVKCQRLESSLSQLEASADAQRGRALEAEANERELQRQVLELSALKSSEEGDGSGSDARIAMEAMEEAARSAADAAQKAQRTSMALEDELERERRRCRSLEGEVAKLGGDVMALEASESAKVQKRHEASDSLAGVREKGECNAVAPARDVDDGDPRGEVSLQGEEKGGPRAAIGLQDAAAPLGEAPKEVNTVTVHPQGEGRIDGPSDIASGEGRGDQVAQRVEEAGRSKATAPSALDGVLVKLVSFIPVP